MEFYRALIVLWCAVTYWLGGQEIPFVIRHKIGDYTVHWGGKGYKAIRRYGLPVGLFLGLYFLGTEWSMAFVSCAFLSASLHLGYQDKLYKFFLTGLLIGLPSLLLGSGWLSLLPVFTHTFYGWISLKQNAFRWAYVAILMGTSIGIAYVR